MSQKREKVLAFVEAANDTELNIIYSFLSHYIGYDRLEERDE